MNGKNNESSSRFFDADDTLNSKLSSSNQQPTAEIAGLVFSHGLLLLLQVRALCLSFSQRSPFFSAWSALKFFDAITDRPG
jgi:hypothetical protein